MKYHPPFEVDRRTFIRQSVFGSLALSSNFIQDILPSNKMGIVVHSYATRYNGKYESKSFAPFTDALQLLHHSYSIGAGGIQTIINDWSPEFSKKIREACESKSMFLEGSIALPRSTEDVGKFENNIIEAKNAGVQIVRTVCLGTRRYESFHSLAEFEQFKTKSIDSIKLAEPILKKYKIKLAVENHKDWRSYELADLLKKFDSEWLGATLDFGNNLALLEDPMQVIKSIAPYAISTHIKDMAVSEYTDGFLLSEVPLGQGILDLKKIVNTCKKYNPTIKFNLEMITRDPLKIPCKTDSFWSTFGSKNEKELSSMLDFISKNASPKPLPTISNLDINSKLSVEEANNVQCMKYSRSKLKLK